MLAEYDLSDSFEQRYVYGNYIDETLCIDDGTAKHYYIHDQLFSTVALVDDTGAVKERYEYDAYGKTIVMDSTFTDIGTSNYANPYLFTGRRLDILDNSSLKIYYYRHRNYDPDTGRFLQHDPLGYVDSMNLYEYVTGNPTNWADPYGTDATTAYSYMHHLNPRMNDPVQRIAQDTAGTIVMVPSAVKAQIDCTAGGICDFFSNFRENIASMVESASRFGKDVIDRNIKISVKVKNSNKPWETFVNEEIQWGKDLYGPMYIDFLRGFCDKIDRAQSDDFWERCRARAEIDIEITEFVYTVKGAVRAGKNALSSVDDIADDIVIRKSKAPREAYNRRKHYGHTPKQSQRRASGAGPDEVLDHDPPLVKRYYEGDPSIKEKPGHLMTEAERKASASDMCRVKIQSVSESNKQGGQMSNYSKQKKKEYGL